MSQSATLTSNKQSTPSILIAGWFSFEYGHATAGDLLALDVTCDWLIQAGFSDFEIAFDPPFNKSGGINWRTVDPTKYLYVIFVCGPFDKNLLEAQFLRKFKNCRLIGLNLSMLHSVDKWKPFDLLYERNSNSTVRADLVFASNEPKVPVVGICLVESYEGALVDEINNFITSFVEKMEIATVYIDTRLDKNLTHLKSKAEIESLIARVDVLITTRLHGTVLALKNGVPVIPIDPEPGGAKIVQQVNKLGWPIIYTAESLAEKDFTKSFNYCFTEEAKRKTYDCLSEAMLSLEDLKTNFISEIKNPDIIEKNYKLRLESPVQENWIDEVLLTNTISNKKSFPKKILRKFKSILKEITN